VGAPTRLIDLAAVEASLRALQREFASINPRLRDRRDELGDDVVGNMLTGYAFVDWIVCRDIDVFAMGNLRTLLELNRLVLCGADEGARQRAAEHLKATEEHFYGEWGAGIRDVVDWYNAHRGSGVWKRAGGVFIRMLSEPQLFIEGNHRTGALLMSYVLLREGKPPFVLTPQIAQAFFDLATLVKKMRKRGLVMQFRMPRLKARFAALLKQNADKQYLLRMPVIQPG
jgi:hypothetical protein